MAQLLVRNIENDVKAKLQLRARRHGGSTEEEVRDILRNAVKEEKSSKAGLGTRLAARLSHFRLKEDIPQLRGQKPRPAKFK
jgi:antitoxin FitA